MGATPANGPVGGGDDGDGDGDGDGRLELWDVAALTTDPRAGLDDTSFDPRFALIVAFDKPDEKLRAVLFRRILPPRARRAADVDVKELARRYPLTGGQMHSYQEWGCAFP